VICLKDLPESRYAIFKMNGEVEPSLLSVYPSAPHSGALFIYLFIFGSGRFELKASTLQLEPLWQPRGPFWVAVFIYLFIYLFVIYCEIESCYVLSNSWA
jgi:hypothetical protein